MCVHANEGNVTQYNSKVHWCTFNFIFKHLNIYKLNVLLGSIDCSHQSEKLGNVLPRAIDFKRNFKQL